MLNRGALFEGDIVFQNMSEAELKLLAYALGLDHHFTMKFGYGKPLGYGNVKISLLYVEGYGSTLWPESKNQR